MVSKPGIDGRAAAPRHREPRRAHRAAVHGPAVQAGQLCLVRGRDNQQNRVGADAPELPAIWNSSTMKSLRRHGMRVASDGNLQILQRALEIMFVGQYRQRCRTGFLQFDGQRRHVESRRGSALSTATPSSTRRSRRCPTPPLAARLHETHGAGAAPPPRSTPAGQPTPWSRRRAGGWRR